MNTIIGIDVSGKGICFQIQNLVGEELAMGSATKDMAGWNSFWSICKARQIDLRQTLVVIEATGRHHLPWCERLCAEGVKVYSLNPLLSKRLYSSRNAIRDNKDDPLDAHTLCEIGRLHGQDLERFCYRSQASRLRLQTLVTARKAIRAQCTNLLKAAGDLFDLIFPEGKSVKLNLTSASTRTLLQQAPTPDKLAQTPISRLEEALGSKAARLRETAAGSFTTQEISKECAEAFVHMLEAIDDLFRQIETLNHTIERTVKAASDKRALEDLIRSLPGFGKVTSAIIAAFLPIDCLQWGNKKKITASLQAYFGFDPRRRISGKHQGQIKISKRGIEIVRTAFYQASFCSLSADPEIRRYYDKKKAENDHHKKAIVDVMRKNLRRMVSVLVANKPYEIKMQNT